MISLADRITIFDERYAKEPYERTIGKLNDNIALRQQDLTDLLGSIVKKRQVAAAWCVYGDLGNAFDSLDDYAESLEEVYSYHQLPQSFYHVLWDVSTLLVSDIKDVIYTHKEKLANLFESIGSDPIFNKFFLDTTKNLRQHKGFDALLKRYTNKYTDNPEESEILTDFFRDTFPIALIFMKQYANKMNPSGRVLTQLGSDSPPTIRGAYNGFINRGLKGVQEGCYGMIDFFGRCPEGEYITNDELSDKDIEKKVEDFSRHLAEWAARYAIDARRRYVEKHDVLNAYKRVDGNPEICRKYEEFKDNLPTVKELLHTKNQ